MRFLKAHELPALPVVHAQVAVPITGCHVAPIRTDGKGAEAGRTDGVRGRKGGAFDLEGAEKLLEKRIVFVNKTLVKPSIETVSLRTRRLIFVSSGALSDITQSFKLQYRLQQRAIHLTLSTIKLTNGKPKRPVKRTQIGLIEVIAQGLAPHLAPRYYGRCRSFSRSFLQAPQPNAPVCRAGRETRGPFPGLCRDVLRETRNVPDAGAVTVETTNQRDVGNSGQVPYVQAVVGVDDGCGAEEGAF